MEEAVEAHAGSRSPAHARWDRATIAQLATCEFGNSDGSIQGELRVGVSVHEVLLRSANSGDDDQGSSPLVTHKRKYVFVKYNNLSSFFVKGRTVLDRTTRAAAIVAAPH